MRKPIRIVIDTNVLVSAMRSRLGFSFELIGLMGAGKFDHVITVPLMMEYEDVLYRDGIVKVPRAAVDDVLDYISTSGLRQRVHYLWRPKLADIKDDMVLEAAVNGQCQYIVTHNIRDFTQAYSLGVKPIQPVQFLTLLKENEP